MLARAQRAVAQEKFVEARNSYRQYLRLNPSDVDAMAELGSLLVDANQLAEAQSVLGQVVQRDPGRYAERKRLVEGRNRTQTVSGCALPS